MLCGEFLVEYYFAIWSIFLKIMSLLSVPSAYIFPRIDSNAGHVRIMPSIFVFTMGATP